MSDLLNASHLASTEWEMTAPEDLASDEFTLVNAVERLRRIAYHKARIAEVDLQVLALVDPLYAEIERIKEWCVATMEAPLASIAHHESWLRRYYELNPPAKDKKHIKLPNGRLETEQPPPKYDYGDAGTLALWLKDRRPDLTKTETVTTFDKVAFKQAVTPVDGVPLIDVGDGERVMVPNVTVTTPPPKFTVVLPKAKVPADD